MEQENSKPVEDVMDWIQKQQDRDYENNKRIIEECNESKRQQAYEEGWEAAQHAIDKWVEFSGVVLSNTQRRLLDRLQYAPNKAKRYGEINQSRW